MSDRHAVRPQNGCYTLSVRERDQGDGAEEVTHGWVLSIIENFSGQKAFWDKTQSAKSWKYERVGNWKQRRD